MSINETLRAVLEPIAPAEADAYEGKKAVYITFNYHTTPINYGDDEPEQERVSVQVHLYAPLGYDITAKRRAVKKALAGGLHLSGLYQRFGQGRSAPCF